MYAYTHKKRETQSLYLYPSDPTRGLHLYVQGFKDNKITNTLIPKIYRDFEVGYTWRMRSRWYTPDIRVVIIDF
jgi:hypothetical protein